MDHHVETTEFDSIGRHVNNWCLVSGLRSKACGTRLLR